MKNITHHYALNPILTFFFNVYVIFLIFDPMRESIKVGALGGILSAARDMCIILCFFLVAFGKRKKRHSSFLLVFWACVVVLICLSPFEADFFASALRSSWGFIRGLMMCFVIINLSGAYIGGRQALLKFFVTVVLICFFFSLYMYFFHPELLTEKYFLNRIGVGNPSMQSVIYISAFSLCFYYKPFKSIANFFVSLLLLLATVSTVTATAFVGLVVVLALTLLNKTYIKEWVLLIVALVGLIVAVIAFSGIDFGFLLGTIRYKVDETVQLFAKYLSRNESVATKSISFNMREWQIENFKNQLQTQHIPLGDGKFAAARIEKNYLIENTYYALFRDFGILGITNFMIFLFTNGARGLCAFFRKKDYAVLVSIAIIAVYSGTLYIFAGTSTMVQLFLLYVLTNWSEYKK